MPRGMGCFWRLELRLGTRVEYKWDKRGTNCINWERVRMKSTNSLYFFTFHDIYVNIKNLNHSYLNTI